MSEQDILIVGGGCSAVAIAAAIVRRDPAARLTIAERSAVPGLGIAYGTESEHHILNVRAKAMGIFDEEPGHFLEWSVQNQHAFDPEEFVSRRIYARYLQQQLDILLQFPHRVVWRCEIVSLQKDDPGYVAVAADGERRVFSRIVLATGHTPLQFPVRRVVGTVDDRFIGDPWRASGYQGIQAIERIGIIGTGLTAIDVIGALDKQGYSGTIELFSRRGLLPYASNGKGGIPLVSFNPLQWPADLRHLVHAVRTEFKRLGREGYDWRPLIDVIRPHIPLIWGRFSEKERGRFLRHLRPYWEVARHRMPIEISERVDTLRKAGRLLVHRGRVEALDFSDPGSVRLLALHRGRSQTFAFDRVYNCSGSAALRPENLPPLLASLQSQGLIALDPFGLGGYTSPRGELLDEKKRPVRNCFVIGPFRRASEWETTAVPEIRRQAREIAEQICAG